MKNTTKRVIIVAAAACVVVLMQWISGIPFQRSPGEAGYFAVCVLFAGIFASYPFDRDDA